MIVPTEIQQWYAENVDRLKLLETKVKEALDAFCYPRGYLYSGRIKTAESLAEKLDTGVYKSWAEIDDCYAGTIVVPTYSHESVIRDFLKRAFSEDHVRARGSAKKSPDVFRFDATRVYCRLADAAYPIEITSLLFEIQIQSAFDYAWQTVTHDLVYKHPKVDWRRSRVAGQMKALVEQLDQIGQNFDNFVDAVPASEWLPIKARNFVVGHIDSLFDSARLPAELEPATRSRVADCVVGYLERDNCKTSELEDKSTRAMAALDDYIQKTESAKIPRGVTLSQLLFGVMFSASIISANGRQRILLTSALELAFPKLKTYSRTFVF